MVEDWSYEVVVFSDGTIAERKTSAQEGKVKCEIDVEKDGV